MASQQNGIRAEYGEFRSIFSLQSPKSRCPVPGFLCCAGREFILTPSQLRVVDDSLCAYSINSVLWRSVVDVDEATDCCFGYAWLSEMGDFLALEVAGRNQNQTRFGCIRMMLAI